MSVVSDSETASVDTEIIALVDKPQEDAATTVNKPTEASEDNNQEGRIVFN